jgi:hypothetical protein
MTTTVNPLRIVGFGGRGALDSGIEVELREYTYDKVSRRWLGDGGGEEKRVSITIPGTVLLDLAHRALHNRTGKAVIGSNRVRGGGIIARRVR